MTMVKEKMNNDLKIINEEDFQKLLETEDMKAVVVFWVANSATALFQIEVLRKLSKKYRNQVLFCQLPVMFKSRKRFIFLERLPSLVFIKDTNIEGILTGIQQEGRIIATLEDLGFVESDE